jgi:ribosomal protein L22
MSAETPERENAEETPVSEAPPSASASETDVSSTPEAGDAVEPTAADEQAAEAASDVLLEADDEAEGVETATTTEEAVAVETPAEAPAPARRPRRRRGGAAAEPASPPAPAPARTRRRDRPAGPARAILAHTPRAIARDWSKLLESAVANAEHNHSLDGEDLYIKAVHADEGPTIKRFRPRAMGRATKIRKRTSHLTILLTPKE